MKPSIALMLGIAISILAALWWLRLASDRTPPSFVTVNMTAEEYASWWAFNKQRRAARYAPETGLDDPRWWLA